MNTPSVSHPRPRLGAAIAVGLCTAILGWFVYRMGLLFNALVVLLLLLAPIRLIAVLWRAKRGTLEKRFRRQPLAPEFRPYLFQAINASLFWLIAAVTILWGVIPEQFTAEELLTIRLQVGIAAVALIALELFPSKRVFRLTSIPLALGWIFLVLQVTAIVWPTNVASAVVLEPPFRGEWLVINGGRSALINHHYGLAAQRHAIDIVKLADGRLHSGDPANRDGYASWDAPLFAPAAGRVVHLENDLPDHSIGESDRAKVAGNHLVIDIGNNRFVLLAHLKRGSIRVNVGDRVKTGELVAHCGNSGNTTMPHLHLQVQDQSDFYTRGVKAHPFVFHNVTHLRSGRTLETPSEARHNDHLIARE